jgi:hypothetical protein
MNNEQEKRTSLADKVLERIEHEGVTPRPRWHFIFSNGMLWALWGVSVLVGAVAVAASIFSFSRAGWQFYAATHNTRLEFIVESLPYVWMGLLVFVTIVAYENIRHTRRGYRYRLMFIMGGSILLSLLFGAVLFKVGVGQRAEMGLGSNLPALSSLVRNEERWVQPQKGILAGEAVTIGSSSSFTLRDFRGGEWEIDTTDLTELDLQVLERTDRLRVIGTSTAEGVFHACIVFPWELDIGNTERPLKRLREEWHERNAAMARTNECEGIRPYELLKGLRAQ